jgi:hypothetical protein
MADKNQDAMRQLEDWQKLFENGHVMVSATSAAMAEEMVTLIKEGFRKETDPYGRKWKPKQANDGRKTLSGETSRLKGGWHVKRTRQGGFTVAPSVVYAAYHQAPRRGRNGRLKRPRRMMVPSGERGMPNAWNKQLREVALTVARGFYSTERAKQRRGDISPAAWNKVQRELASAKRKLGIKG